MDIPIGGDVIKHNMIKDMKFNRTPNLLLTSNYIFMLLHMDVMDLYNHLKSNTNIAFAVNNKPEILTMLCSQHGIAPVVNLDMFFWAIYTHYRYNTGQLRFND